MSDKLISIKSMQETLKQFLDKDIYDNIFVKDNLTLDEIKLTLQTLRTIRLGTTPIKYSFENRLEAQRAYSIMKKQLYTYDGIYRISIYLFANAIYIKVFERHRSCTINNTTVVKAPIGIPLVLCGEYTNDDVYFVVDGCKVLGAFYENMKERRVVTTVTEDKVKLPIIRDKEMKKDILSAITLLKLGGN